MPEINLRDLVGDIREALERHPREALVEILTYVFKEYVVEGPAPLATATAAPRETVDDLEGMSFAQVIQRLQLRLDLPELALFHVQGDRVYFKLGGRDVLVEAQSSRPEPAPAPAPLAAPTTPPVPPAGVTTASVPLPARAPAATQQPAPAPREEPSRSPAATQQRPAAPAAAPQQPAAAQPASPSSKPATTKEEAETQGRFSRLEVD